MKRRLLIALLACTMIVPAFTASACGGGNGGSGLTLNLAVKYDANSMITYNQETAMLNGKAIGEYKAANGKTYKDGDIKPVWEELANRLDFEINDVVYNEYLSTGNNKSLWEAALGKNFAGIDMITATADNFVQEGTTNGRFVNFADHLDKMPNFSAFLDENSVVKASITDASGAMYYAPYFDGYDDIERMFMLRVDWVEKLLDGPKSTTLGNIPVKQEDGKADVSLLKDTAPLAKGAIYQPYMPATMTSKSFTIVKADGSATETITKSYTTNIIAAQNASITASATPEDLVKQLRDYIDATYSNKFGTKRSQLFTGVNAAYDPDELIALLRVVKANPKYLVSNKTTQEEIVPFYPRNNTPDRVMDVYRLSQIWGVRGVDSRRGFLFVDKDGHLKDSRMEQKTMDGLEMLNQLYDEGLILTDFDKALDGFFANNGDNSHRGKLNTYNLGFMTYDYNQTTTVHNNLTSTISGFNLTPILPPFTNWSYEEGKMAGNSASAVYTRYTESWRSVKPDGWGIFATVTGEKLDKCLELVDYLYSVEGNKLMSYGPSDWIDGTIEYGGREVPKLSDAALEELTKYAANNYTNYYRRFLGGTFPIGYVKEQGMEYQTVHEKGRVGLDNILKAIELGTMKHAVVDNAAESDKTLWSVPTTLPFSKPQQDALAAATLKPLSDAFNTSSSGSQALWLNYVKYGFGNTTPATLSEEALISYVKTKATNNLYGAEFLEINEAAFKKAMGL